jgi:hypothetical protein
MNRLLVASAIGVVLASVIGGAGGCNGKTSGDNTGNTQPSSASIGAAGGTVSSSDGQASVTIPAGALISNITVTITPVASVSIPDVTVVGTAYQFEPGGMAFAKPVTVSLTLDATKISAPAATSDARVMTAADGSQSFAALATTLTDATHVTAQTTHFSTYVPALPTATIPLGDASVPVTDAGLPTGENCVVACEGPDNIDSGIGCNCGVTCGGIVYQVQCVCGACTCYLDGVAGKTTTLSTSACNSGGQGLLSTYFNTCGYPGAKNQGSSGGPTSMDGGGSCPGG